MTHPSHSLWFLHPNTLWGVQIMKPLIMHLFPTSCYLLFLMSKYLLQRPDQGLSQLNEKDQVSHTYETTCKILRLYISIFMLWNWKADGKISDSTGGNYSPTRVTTKGLFYYQCSNITRFAISPITSNYLFTSLLSSTLVTSNPSATVCINFSRLRH